MTREFEKRSKNCIVILLAYSGSHVTVLQHLEQRICARKFVLRVTVKKRSKKSSIASKRNFKPLIHFVSLTPNLFWNLDQMPFLKKLR